MKRLRPSLVAAHEDVLNQPLARARMERMLGAMEVGEFREVNDASLAALVQNRWQNPTDRNEDGTYRDPDIVFSRWRFDGPETELQARAAAHPCLGNRRLLGDAGLMLRDDADLVHRRGSVCTTAWEFHSIIGCPFHCGYCGLGKGFINIAANIEEQVAMLDRWTRRNNFQTIYKWDNQSDINCFEPEFDATRLFVEYFRDCPDKYLLHYTGKSDNVDFMLDYDHGGKTIIQWSLAPRTQARLIEVGSAPWDARIEAARKCQEAGYIVRFRFSPILPVRNWREEYVELIDRIFAQTNPDVVSLCFFGWMDLQAMRGCFDEALLDPWALEACEREEAEVMGRRYGPFPHSVRRTVHRFLVDEIRKRAPAVPLSLCLESEEMWSEFAEEMGRKGDGFLCNCGPVCTPGTAFYENRQAFVADRAAAAEPARPEPAAATV